MNLANLRNEQTRHQAIADYARKYAQHRTIPFLVQTVVTLALFGLVFGAAVGAGHLMRTENPFLIILAFVLLAASVALVVWLSVPGWGGRRVWAYAQGLYGSEGHAGIRHPSQLRLPKWGYLLVPSIVILLMVHYGMTKSGLLPVWLAQPVSLLYLVPFWYLMYRVQRPLVGPWMLLAPAFSLVFALLVLAGAPVASNQLNFFWLNVYVPMFGFQVLAMILGHVYSRYALRQLKTLAQPDIAEISHD